MPLAPLADTECEDFEVALATNVLGPFRLTKALLGLLASSARESKERGARSLVVLVSSDAAVTPYPGWGAYGASKAALAHLGRIWNEGCATGSRSSSSTRRYGHADAAPRPRRPGDAEAAARRGARIVDLIDRERRRAVEVAA